jgi:hypothetical protein
VSTIAAIVLGIGGMTVLGVVLTARSGDLRWLFLGLPVAILLLLVARWAPTGYRLGADGLQIGRKAGPRTIAYRQMRGVDAHPRPLRGFTVSGSNGVFGRFGLFWNRHLGFYRLYLSGTHAVVWLSTDRGFVGLSPDRPADFVERLQRRLAILGQSAGGR